MNTPIKLRLGPEARFNAKSYDPPEMARLNPSEYIRLHTMTSMRPEETPKTE